MGKKGWFSAVKKALTTEPKEKDQPKKQWFGRHKSGDSIPSSEEVLDAVPAPPQYIDESKFVEEENGQDNNTCPVATATAAVAEADVTAAQAVTTAAISQSRYSGKSKEEVAAIKIQTAFRGYLARRTLRSLRGLVRLKSLIEGQSVKRQATTTLRCMQTLARVQSQVRARRIRMSEENQALQRQLQQQHEKELEKLRMGEVWDDSMQSKEQMEANLQNKQDAAMRRERALAYAFSHQTRKNPKSAIPTFTDPNNPQWGWSWLERWMAARPWDTSNITDKELNDHSSVKSALSQSLSSTAQTKEGRTPDNKPSATAQRPSRPPSRQSSSTLSRAASSTPTVGRQQGNTKVNHSWGADDDAKSAMISIQTEKFRRHSIAGSLVRDDESLASSPGGLPSYMAPTRSRSAKSKSKAGTLEKDEPLEKESTGHVKKRLSFSAGSQTRPRRHSVPGKIESSPVKDGVADAHQEGGTISNGRSR